VKPLETLKADQADFCAKMRHCAGRFALDIHGKTKASCVLLTGSIARGDARPGKYGVLVDLTLVSVAAIDLAPLYGPSTEPDLPFYCTSFNGAGFQIKRILETEFFDLSKSESEAFSLSESIVLFEKESKYSKFISERFPKRLPPRKDVALYNYWRFLYLCNDYRYEKWLFREAYTQLAENFHEAFECFANFLYAVNGSFIPRKDWLIYLLYGLTDTPPDLERIIESAMSVIPGSEGIRDAIPLFTEIELWMKSMMEKLKW
jgi:hypothetical protein